jgi:hypothetical protein
METTAVESMFVQIAAPAHPCARGIPSIHGHIAKHQPQSRLVLLLDGLRLEPFAGLATFGQFFLAFPCCFFSEANLPVSFQVAIDHSDPLI